MVTFGECFAKRRQLQQSAKEAEEASGRSVLVKLVFLWQRGKNGEVYCCGALPPSFLFLSLFPPLSLLRIYTGRGGEDPPFPPKHPYRGLQDLVLAVWKVRSLLYGGGWIVPGTEPGKGASPPLPGRTKAHKLRRNASDRRPRGFDNSALLFAGRSNSGAIIAYVVHLA